MARDDGRSEDLITAFPDMNSDESTNPSSLPSSLARSSFFVVFVT